MPTDFSYERDVAPYGSRLFDEIGGDPRLSSAAKVRLQGTLLKGLDDIQAQRDRLAEERAQGRQRELAYQSGVLALEEARARRSRIEQAQARTQEFKGVAKSILAETGDPEEAKRKLAAAAIDHADNPDAMDVFRTAAASLPERKELISDAQTLALVLDGIPQEEILLAKQTGDFSRIGEMARKIKNRDLAQREILRIGRSQDAEARQVKLGLAKARLKFARDPETQEESPWMEDESTKTAEAVVLALGTPEEQKKFAALRNAPSDKDRASLVKDIQLRYLSGVVGAEPEQTVSGRSITGDLPGVD